ncbi:hypothetical protein F4703DRAFT_1916948 [Phycomyces blakesleeanus]
MKYGLALWRILSILFEKGLTQYFEGPVYESNNSIPMKKRTRLRLFILTFIEILEYMSDYNAVILLQTWQTTNTLYNMFMWVRNLTALRICYLDCVKPICFLIVISADSPIYGLIHVSAFIHHTSTCEECDELPMPQSCRRQLALIYLPEKLCSLNGSEVQY